MNAPENQAVKILSPLNYWRLWLLDTLLVVAGMLFFLAMQYGTFEFFGAACLMALLPLIPAVVLIGGGGSTVFVLTKVMIEKRLLKRPAALALLVGPGVVVCLLCVLLGMTVSTKHQLSYICAGNAPVSASQMRVAGYSTFLKEEWLAVFNVDQAAFQTMVAKAELVPADEFEFNNALEKSSIKRSALYQSLPKSSGLSCFKRVFKPGEEHQRGDIYAEFDAASGVAAVFREYRD